MGKWIVTPNRFLSPANPDVSLLLSPIYSFTHLFIYPLHLPIYQITHLPICIYPIFLNSVCMLIIGSRAAPIKPASLPSMALVTMVLLREGSESS